ncbi:MAG: KH domain-containing protein [Fimbriimonadaceae bacterium]|nr:KH domain-containing protein [Fimbriimonadaceae bacterium]
MTSIEITASSLDEAKSQAAQKLSVPADQLSVTVLEEAKGLFGQSKVTIKAEVSGSAPSAPATDKPKRGRTKKEEVVEEAVADTTVAEEAPVKEAKSKPARTPRGAKKESAEGNKAEGDTKASDEPEVIATQDDADAIADVIDEIIEASGLNADVDIVNLENRYVHISVKGEDASYLIGRRGEVLNSFQYLMNVVTARRIRNGVRVVMDAAEYRERRREVLTDLATQIAEQVVARGEEAVLDALPAFERRIVHQALQEIEGITTYSEGEEPNRRVVIAPAEA